MRSGWRGCVETAWQRCSPTLHRHHPPSTRRCEQINEGRYWQAHESLEAVWLPSPYPLRLFYYALIKLAVGLLHLERGNTGGARQQLQAAVDFLAPFAPRFHGLRTDLLLADARVRLEAVNAGGGDAGGALRVRWEDTAA